MHRPTIRDSQGHAVEEIQELRDQIEVALGQEVAVIATKGDLRFLSEEEYHVWHDEVVDRLMPSDPYQIAHLLGKEPPANRNEWEEMDVELFENVSFAYDQITARFGGEQLVVVSVHPNRGLRLWKMFKLGAEGWEPPTFPPT